MPTRTDQYREIIAEWKKQDKLTTTEWLRVHPEYDIDPHLFRVLANSNGVSLTDLNSRIRNTGEVIHELVIRYKPTGSYQYQYEQIEQYMDDDVKKVLGRDALISRWKKYLRRNNITHVADRSKHRPYKSGRPNYLQTAKLDGKICAKAIMNGKAKLWVDRKQRYYLYWFVVDQKRYLLGKKTGNRNINLLA